MEGVEICLVPFFFGVAYLGLNADKRLNDSLAIRQTYLNSSISSSSESIVGMECFLPL